MKIAGAVELLNLYFNLCLWCLIYANIYPVIHNFLCWNSSYLKLPIKNRMSLKIY